METVAEAAGDALIYITDIDSLLNRLLARRKYFRQGVEAYYEDYNLRMLLARTSLSRPRAILLKVLENVKNEEEPGPTTEPPTWEDLPDYVHFYRTCVEDAEMVRERLGHLKSLFPALEEHRYFTEATQAAESLCEFLAELRPGDFLTESYISAVNRVSFANDHLAKLIAKYLDNTTLTVQGIEEFASLSMIENNAQAVVQHAFAHFEERLRQRLALGAEVFGRELINEAFGQHGRLRYGATEAERERTRDFMAGAYGLFRNPRNHRLLDDDTGLALSLLVIINVMLKILENASDR